MRTGLRLWLVGVLLYATAFLYASSVVAAELLVEIGGSTRKVTTEELLARPDAATIEVPDDISFHRTMSYRAVPLRALLAIDGLPADQELQITGTDGFATNLPSNLVFADGGKGAVPWLAIEEPDKPWPPTAEGVAIGPFYLVWLNPAASGVMSEQWPYKVDSIRAVSVRTLKWPQLLVGDDEPADSPARTGQLVFATQCMACHRLGGAGDATMGPDLNLPSNPTEYLQPWALKALIRNPASLRAWPDMKMHGFEPSVMKDSDIDAVVAYLSYMAAHRH